MAKILCITSGLTGILNASFELARRIGAEGNECILSSPRDVADNVKAQGFNFLHLDPINFDPAPALPSYTGALRKIKRLIYKYRFLEQRKREAIKELGMDSFLQKVKEINPDQILIDIELHEHIMTLVANGLNPTLLSQWFSIWNRKGLPPIVTDIIPGKGLRGSAIGMRWAWTKIKVQRWWMFYKKKLLSGGTDRRSILFHYADHIGFSRSYIKENYWPGPFSYDKLPVQSMTLASLDFPHNQRPNLEYIGPMVFENRVDIKCPPETKAEIDELIEEKKKTGKKLIYCSVSTFKSGDSSFIKKVIEAVERNPSWMLIIGLGGKLAANFTSLPANVHSFSYVPQIQVLKAADLSINHGGIHTINECIHFGVPMLVYSGKRSDQNGCAARVHYYGLGLMGDKDRDGVEEIGNKIKIVLSNETFKGRINNLKEE